MGNFTGLEKKFNLPTNEELKITGITQAIHQRNDQNPGSVLCNYLASQEHSVQTPRLLTAFPNKLLQEARQDTAQVRTRTTEPVSKAHTPSQSTLSQRKTWRRQPFDVD